MRTDLSPWFREALEPHELRAVLAADPQDATVFGLASSPKGPFRASITRNHRAIGSGESTTPALAIARAVEASLEQEVA